MPPLGDEPTFHGSVDDISTRLIVAGAGISSTYTLPLKGDLLIGRLAQAHIVIPDASVSRRHALLRVLGVGSFSLQDLKSANGTSVNSQTLEAGKTVSLRPGDVIRVGDVAILVRGPQLEEPDKKVSEA